MQVYPHSSFECASSHQCSNWPHSDSNRIEFTIRLRESTFALLPAVTRHTRSIDLLCQIQWVCIRRSYYRSNVDSNVRKKIETSSRAYRKIEQCFSCVTLIVRSSYVSRGRLKARYKRLACTWRVLE